MAVVAVLLLAATILPASASAQENRRNPHDIRGYWQLLEYRDASGEMVPVPPGIGATLLPFAGVIEVDAACSSYQTAYEQTLQSIFIEPPGEIAQVQCDAAAQAVDDAFQSDLRAAATVVKSGSILEIRDAIEAPLLTLTDATIPTDPTIARWEVARIGAASGSIEPVIQGAEPWIEFLRGGSVVGSSGCGSFLGRWSVNDSTISITDLAYRLAECTEPVQHQAEAILETFQQITDFEMLPAGLTLLDENATTRLALIPAIELGNRTWTPVAIFDEAGEPLPLSERLNTSAVRFGGGRAALGTADGRSYCRGFDGRSLISGLALSTSRIQPLKGNCPDRGPDENTPRVVETAFLDALRQTSSHALRGSQLELMNAQGRPIMRLVPQAELVGPTWVVDWMDVAPNAARERKRAPRGTTPLTAKFDEISIVVGDTGASDRTGSNGFLADYATPGAAQIRISGASTDGRACNGAKASKPLCKQERAYLALLESADGFIVRDTDLRLLKGPRPILSFVVETPDTVDADD